MPRVSVIIPTYNAKEHLPETLRSIVAQTFRDWEVVVADDASTDATAAVAEGFGARFKVLRAAHNSGPAAARNRAIAAASGELLVFLDADDLWLPEYLERQVGLYDASASGGAVGIVACDAQVLTVEGLFPQTYMELMRFPREVTLTRLLASNPIYVSALVPRAIVEELGGFCDEIFGTEDHDLWLRIVECGYRVVANREPLAVYRLGTASVSAGLGRMARALQTTYRRALDRGNLTPRQRRIARRELRMSRALEQVDAIRTELRGGRRPYRRTTHALPLLLRVAVEHPNSWRGVGRRLVGRKHRLAVFER
jgi:glycosyltransferase involved in cell wall biosynthesis